MARTLSEFAIDDQGDTYLLTLRSDEGDSYEIEATYAQLDLMVEAIEARLDEDEAEELAAEGED